VSALNKAIQSALYDTVLLPLLLFAPSIASQARNASLSMEMLNACLPLPAPAKTSNAQLILTALLLATCLDVSATLASLANSASSALAPRMLIAANMLYVLPRPQGVNHSASANQDALALNAKMSLSHVAIQLDTGVAAQELQFAMMALLTQLQVLGCLNQLKEISLSTTIGLAL
jgi:hypothetical protein